MILEYRACSNCRERRMASLQKFHYRMTCDKNYMVCCNINFVLAINFELYLICIHLFTIESSKLKCYLGSNTLCLSFESRINRKLVFLGIDTYHELI